MSAAVLRKINYSVIICRAELDDIGEPDHYLERFQLMLSIVVSDNEQVPEKRPAWESHSMRHISSDILFSSTIERDECFDTFGTLPR